MANNYFILIFNKVPQLLNTIWTSKNAEEVQDVPEKIYTAFLMHQQQLLSQDPTDEDQAVLLCEFLVEGMLSVLKGLRHIN